MGRIALNTKWKNGKLPMSILQIVELLGIVAALTMFGVAAPDTYRSRLRLAGGAYGLNHDPAMDIYIYANHGIPPPPPLAYSAFTTNFNVAISVVFLFAMLVKAVLYVVNLLYPILSLIFHLIAAAIWAFSAYAQLAPDDSDPAFPTAVPWYFRTSCDGPPLSQRPPPGPAGVPKLINIPHYCVLARSSLAVTLIMIAIYLAYIGLALHSLFKIKPKDSGKEIDGDSFTSDIPTYQPEAGPKPEFIALASPRTQAFNRLDGGDSLPFRKYQNQS